MRWLALPVIAVALAALAYGLWPRSSPSISGGFGAATLAAAVEELERGSGADADAPGVADGDAEQEPLSFPADHGAHPDALTELWDLTAFLRGADEQALALRLTIARLRLASDDGGRRAAVSGEAAQADASTDTETVAPRRASALAAGSVLAGSLVLSSNETQRSARGERMSRAVLGLAGAEAGPDGQDRVWIEDWELARGDDGGLRLSAEAGGMQLNLSLSPGKPPVALDQAAVAGGADQGPDAMRLYSQSRLAVSGSLLTDGITHELHGSAWLDHAWGSLAGTLVGRQGQLIGNRFQLQLDNGIELACLHLRRRAGGGTPIASCALINVDSELVPLARREVSLTPVTASGTSIGGTGYPLHWRLLIPGRGLELAIEPLLDDAPDGSLSAVIGSDQMWSGPVVVKGWRESDAIGGVGRMDLNGYGESGPSGT